MRLKSMLKKVIGEKRISKIKGILYHYACKIQMLVKKVPNLDMDDTKISLKYILTEPGYHVYRGYYDLDYLNSDNKNFLCHRLPITSLKKQKIKCDIGYYDLNTKIFYKITDTFAWCWQQGSRLRWHPLKKDCILVNDVQNKKYCTKVYNINTKECIGIIEKPLYDVTSDFTYGLSLNFSRLQRMRPGYGYSYLEDDTKNISAPNNDGIFLINLKTNENKLLFSLEDLAKKVDTNGMYEHYVNHICIAPDNQNFIFFHIYLNSKEKNWKTVLYVSDIHGKNLKMLEMTDRVSHYCWIDERKIMMTCIKEEKCYYCIYDIKTLKKDIINLQELNKDGHPSKMQNSLNFITDTYPLKNSRQKLLEFSLYEDKTHILASTYHDYRLRGEKRCDLHPVLSNNDNYISIDTTFKNKRRSILIFERKGEKKYDKN